MDPNEQSEQPAQPEQSQPQLPPAEAMRRSRLAKLGNAAPASPSSEASTPASPGASSPAGASAPKPTPMSSKAEDKPPPSAPTQKSSPSTSDNPFAAKGVKKMSDSPLADALADAHIRKKVHIAKEENLDDWSDRTLGGIFLVTLDEAKTTDGRSAKMAYLPELKEELQQANEPLKLTASNIDTAVNESARKFPQNKPLLDYLLPCWKRMMRALKAARKLAPEKKAVLEESKRLCMSNCIFAITMPEYFSREPNDNHDTLVPYLLRHHDNDDGICLDFYEEAAARIKDGDDSVADMFTDAMVNMSSQLATMSMNDNYKPYINCLSTYARFGPLLDALVEHPRFLVDPEDGSAKANLARASETETILGPFFRISPLQPEVCRTYFGSPRTIDSGHRKSSQSALQMTLKAHQSDLLSIMNCLVRRGQPARDRTLEWLAFIMNTNHKRRALQVDPRTVASDGFMVNITAILDKLCEPFMDSTFSKVSKIDIDYLRRSPRVDMSDETKLNADQSTSEKFYGNKVEGTSNFISEIFFLTLAAHHYGLGATQATLKTLDREIKHIEKIVREMEEALAKVPQAALRAPMQRHHTTAINALEKAIALKYSIEGVVLDQSMQTLSLQFMRYVSVWLLRVASGTDYVPGQKMQLPLSSDKPEAFSCLPEYAVQDVVDNFKFVFRSIPQILMSAVGDEIVTLCITFLRSSEYIKNPYLKSSFVTLLFSGTWPIYHLSKGVLGDTLTGSDFANENLLHALMRFYIECEHSGVSSAFYDKFNIRYEIFQVMKCIWANPVYQQQLSKESRTNKQFFVQFVNLLLNDATFLLDEALTKLYKIHELQKRLKEVLTPEEREKTTTELESAEGQCQSWMQLVNDTMAMMKLFTGALREAFTMPEIVVRLAGMLDYNLEVLVGPRRANLKVEDPKKYHFDARTLLSEFIDIYLNLGPSDTFVEAVASDGRSYKPENFEQASRILSNHLHAAPETAVKWDKLRKKIAQAKERLDQAELDLGEIPDEFEDPLMGELMTDPVVLPSTNIVDRKTIIQQLLSNPLDPFTRAPMKIEDVVPADDLRQRIEAWKAERVAAAQAKTAGEQMDTSEG